jgi:hypothetical protein
LKINCGEHAWRLSRVSWNLSGGPPLEACRLVGVGRSAKNSDEKGTAVPKTYQTTDADDATDAELVLPESVAIVMQDLVGQLNEGLLALAVGAGLQVMDALMAESVTALAGSKGKHDPARTAVRHGSEAGSVVLGGRRLPVRRPRVRTADGSAEVPVPAYELFASTDLLNEMTWQRMLAKLSTRKYETGLEPVGADVAAAASATSKSAVSRRFVKSTERALTQLMTAGLGGLELVGLMIDGVNFARHCCVVALGIDIEGRKHPLAVVEGSTENADLARHLLVGLRERGLDVTRPILVVIDGSKALRRAVIDVFERPVIQRCVEHKIRNVRGKLPARLCDVVQRRMRLAYYSRSALEAEASLRALANELDKTHPGAAESLREGLEETLTVLKLDLPPTLACTFRTTNAIESMISISRDHAANVKRWRDGRMALRWCAAGMIEAGKQFRRIKGHMHLPVLILSLNNYANTARATEEVTDAA